MWTNQHNRMLTALRWIVAGGLSLCADDGRSADNAFTGRAAAQQLTERLAREPSVTVYLLSSTGTYDLPGAASKTEADMSITAYCDGNCATQFQKLVSHLSNAVRAKCLKGQQDTLVEVPSGILLEYSYSGRQVRFNGACYMNLTASMVEVLHDKDFWFE